MKTMCEQSEQRLINIIELFQTCLRKSRLNVRLLHLDASAFLFDSLGENQIGDGPLCGAGLLGCLEVSVDECILRLGP